MIFWACEKIGGHVNLTWSHVRWTCRIFSLFLSLAGPECLHKIVKPVQQFKITALKQELTGYTVPF